MHAGISNAFPSFVSNRPIKTQRSDFDGASDFRCAVAFPIAKEHNRTTIEVAKEIVACMPSNGIFHAQVTPEGMIQINVDKDWIAKHVHSIATHGPQPLEVDLKKVVVDYGSPNFGKELHVGHMRSFIIGDAIANVLSYIGHQVERISHVGDFGVPLAIVMSQGLLSGKDMTAKEDKLLTAQDLSQLYIDGKKKLIVDPKFADIVGQMVKEFQKLEKATPEIFAAWKTVCMSSRKLYEGILKRLDVHVKEKGESTYEPMLRGLIEELREKKLSVNKNGAQCIWLPTQKEGKFLPFFIQKAEGGWLYASTDLAALKHRIEEGKEWIVYVTDEAQASHFSSIFKISRMAKWSSTVQLSHVGFGLVKGKDGKKLSSREGSPYPLLSLLNEGVQVASALPRKTGQMEQVSGGEWEEAIAIGALKYFDLRHLGNYIVDFEKMLSFKGNTSVYLLYAYCRLRALQRSSPGKWDNYASPPSLDEEKERRIALKVLEFCDAIAEVEHNLAPSELCHYLYQLVSEFHKFYDQVRIAGTPEEESRKQLCLAILKTLEKGLNLLGIPTVESL